MSARSNAPATVACAGMISSVGQHSLQCSTSVRAGIARVRSTPVHSREFVPVAMGLVPDEVLPPLAPAFESHAPMSQRRARMLRLAGAALDEVAKRSGATGLPLYLALPEALPGRRATHQGFVDDLAVQLPGAIDPATSAVFAEGRAGFFTALLAAMSALASGGVSAALVGGVDSYLDLATLATLDRDGRLLTRTRRQGMIPGEGAAMVLLTRDVPPSGAWARVEGAAVDREPGHLGSDEPLRCEGLSSAVRGALEAASHPVSTVLAGLNGEYLVAREWGVAARRAQDRLAGDVAVSHPVECFGDPGAALGAMLLALGAIGVGRATERLPVLVWSASDGATRGAALLGPVV